MSKIKNSEKCHHVWCNNIINANRKFYCRICESTLVCENCCDLPYCFVKTVFCTHKDCTQYSSFTQCDKCGRFNVCSSNDCGHCHPRICCHCGHEFYQISYINCFKKCLDGGICIECYRSNFFNCIKEEEEKDEVVVISRDLDE